MNFAEMVYSLYVVFFGAMLVAGCVKFGEWLIVKFRQWDVRREMRAFEAEERDSGQMLRSGWDDY